MTSAQIQRRFRVDRQRPVEHARRRSQLARWRPPPLRPRRSAFGSAGLRSGRRQHNDTTLDHLRITSNGKLLPGLFHLTITYICESPFCPCNWGTRKREGSAPKARVCISGGARKISSVRPGDFWGGNGKAEDTKPPGAGIPPKPCPMERAEKRRETEPSRTGLWGDRKHGPNGTPFLVSATGGLRTGEPDVGSRRSDDLAVAG